LKRTPLKRRVSIRDGYLRRLKAEKTDFQFNFAGQRFRKRPVKKMGRARRSRLKEYYALTLEFLRREENRLCLICQVRREHGENICIQPATEVHHHRGRRGRLLTWVPGFRPSCYGCRLWPHDNKRLAREYGLLASTVLYDVFPEDEPALSQQ
jgi:hypothetical protein